MASAVTTAASSRMAAVAQPTAEDGGNGSGRDDWHASFNLSRYGGIGGVVAPRSVGAPGNLKLAPYFIAAQPD